MATKITHQFVSAKPNSLDATLINPSNWNDVHSITGIPYFDITNFGAVCDGVTDDTAALIAAITAIPANGGIIVFPGPNLCIIGSSITISKPNVTLLGIGWHTGLKAKANSNLGVLLAFDENAVNCNVKNLCLDGNRDNHGMASPNSWILSAAGSNFILDCCEVRFGSNFGIVAGSNITAPTNFTIQDCFVHHNGGPSSGGVGYYAIGTKTPIYTKILNSRWESNCTQSGVISDGAAIVLNQYDTTNGALVEGNYCLNNYNVGGGQIATQSPGGPQPNIAKTIIKNNIIVRTGSFLSDHTYGIELYGNNSVCDGNIIDGSYRYGILNQSNNNVIVNNNIKNVAVGILCSLNTSGVPGTALNTQRTVISNNNITASEIGIQSENITDFVITGNSLVTPKQFSPYPGDTFLFALNSPNVKKADSSVVTLGNSTVSTILKRAAIPAGYFFGGRAVRVKYWGILSSAGVAGDHATILIADENINTLAAVVSFDNAAVNVNWEATIEVIFDASGVMKYNQLFFLPTQSFNPNVNNGSYTFDPTIAHNFVLAVQWNAAKVGNTLTVFGVTVEEL